MLSTRITKLLAILFFPLLMSSQSIKRMNFTLDSILNSNVPYGHTVLIFVKNDVVSADTLTYAKIRPQSDTTTTIIYRNGCKKTVNNKDLWGYINDFGQRRRIYFGESYIVWHASSPCIYRKNNLNTYSYYFSRSPSREIVYMSLENIDAVDDPITRQWLEDFYHDNSVQRKQAINNAVDVSVDLTCAIFRLALFALEIYSKNH